MMHVVGAILKLTTKTVGVMFEAAGKLSVYYGLHFCPNSFCSIRLIKREL